MHKYSKLSTECVFLVRLCFDLVRELLLLHFFSVVAFC